MSGLLARQPAYVERIAATCRATLRRHVRTSGFISYDLGEEDIGETAAPGDTAQLADAPLCLLSINSEV